MDKKNTTIGVALLIAAVAAFIFAQRNAPPKQPAASETYREPPAAGAEATPSTTPAATPDGTAAASTAEATPALNQAATDSKAIASVATENSLQSVVSLSNAFVDVEFTDFGGAIHEVGILQYPAHKNNPAPYVFNQLHFAPLLSFVGATDIDHTHKWELVEKSDRKVVYRTLADGRLEITRTFTLPGPGDEGDPYRLRQETTFKNIGDTPIAAQRISLNLGTASPVSSNDAGLDLTVGDYNGEDSNFIGRNALQGGGFLSWIGVRDNPEKPFIDRDGRFTWVCVKNQFFASILTPDADTPAVGLRVRRVELPPFPDSNRPDIGITGDATFELPQIAPGASANLNGWLYVGPKEYKRLSQLGQHEDVVMQFGFFQFFAKLLLTMMTWFHDHAVANYGVAIILTTLVLRTVFMPLTLTAAKSSKRMAKIQEPLKALREKYKDNPQKLQKETLELFKANKVNPVGGCLPILVTIPFFFGFFAMLRTSSEVRFAEFLWIADLSSPDTIAHVFGFPLNIMPLLMTASMFYQMHLTPTPTVDNAQAKIMKFMPVMMLIFCYSFSSALSLYWTVSNIFTIAQQLIINRMKDETPVVTNAHAPAAGLPGGKKKKKR